MFKLEKIKPATYLLPKTEGMRVPGIIIANSALLEDVEMEKPLEQVRNVAHLPGIVGYSIAMPDIHWGYGFPIGGVAAMDAETGVISPGGVGYDINCGVRLAIVPLPYKEMVQKVRKALLDRIFHLVPAGVGHGHKGGQRNLSDEDYRQLIEKGAAWSVGKGYGFAKDLDHIESRGVIEGADIKAVSKDAMMRGRDQLGSIGSGNHFVEIGEISHLFLPEIAKAWGVDKGQTYILIHSGSRGFGHQICQDTLNSFITQGFAEGLPDRQLVAAPIRSKAGQQYFSAMAAAANFAFNNRQQILHGVREAFSQICGILPEEIHLIYDVCHNIAKFETHVVDGVARQLCVHRKGATRAFGPGSPELAPIFRQTGQPVLVPGDMGRASHLMAGLGNPLTWCSACHGAGRARSRHQSMKAWGGGREAINHMEKQGILVMASSYRTIAEEMPDAYKDVDSVVEAVEEAGLAKRVARLRPSLVLKG
jgi:tRNA-splicing ligase RtcB (3'-phosphate/5'-hydroxy nucleic acid ligase)